MVILGWIFRVEVSGYDKIEMRFCNHYREFVLNFILFFLLKKAYVFCSNVHLFFCNSINDLQNALY